MREENVTRKRRFCEKSQDVLTPNRQFKSRIFTMIFEDKRNLLELYNAVSGKHYEDPELLVINTLDNAIYMAMRNDLSFLIDARLSLYEHQSTYSPNLPLRFLLYIADLYSAMIRNENLYGRTKILIPPPQFLIFYNGEEEQPERRVLKLSDMFGVEEEHHKLELEAVLLNINIGFNDELMEACHTLWEYAEYTKRVRKYAAEFPIDEAVERAIVECIREGILKEFLAKNRTEAKKMSIYEYDQEKHIRQERETAWKEGHAEGKAEGEEELLVRMIMKKLEKRKSVSEIAEELEETEERIRGLMEKIT